jgi:hypothetical protein
MNEIDEFLRANKPAVKDDPTFLLETRRRLEAVEGIKAEVDRQRSRGRLVRRRRPAGRLAQRRSA